MSYWKNLSNCGDDLDNSKLPTQRGDMLGAKGNSGDMVIKFIDESIDATKYLTVMRYGFNE